MALDARTRSSILDSLVPVMGEDNANALMSEFPSVEADELVTKQFLRAELAELRADLRGELSGLRDELRGEIGEVRAELAGLGSALRGEIGEVRHELRSDQASFRAEVADRFHQQSVRFGVALAGALTLQTAVLGTLISLQ